MKYFLLIITLFYLLFTIKGLFKIKTGKQNIDEALKDKMPINDTEKNIFIILMLILSILPVLYLIFCIKFIGTFIFTIVGTLYILWSLLDLTNIITYIKENKVNKLFDNKLYYILSKPFDLGFCIFMVYQIFIKWNN